MKSQFLKLCSMVLIFTLLLNLFPAQAIALGSDKTEITPEETHFAETSSQEFSAESATIIAEIPEKRTAFTKDYKLSNGFNMSVVYPEVVHYEEDGQWKEIDNTLKLSGTGANSVYNNTAGGWNAIFPQQLTKNNRVSVVKGAYTVSFGMAGELRSDHELMSEDDQVARTMITTEEMAVTQMQSSFAQVVENTSAAELAEMEHPDIVREKLYSRLSYEDVYNNVDIIYDLSGYQLKESIVINSYDSNLRGYQYVLETGALTPVLNDDGSIDLFAPENEEAVMEMPAPYMVDSAGAVSYDVGISLVPQNGSYLLTYSVPTSWMADSSRVWPVVLDPAVVAVSDYNNILDQFVAENYSVDYKFGGLFCGYHQNFGKMRSFIQYVNLPVLNSADVVVYAELSLRYLYLEPSPSSTTIIEAHKVCDKWDSQTITWANKPQHINTVEDYAIVSGDAYYNWVITDAVRNWYASENTGIMLKAPDSVEAGPASNWQKFFSIDYGSSSSIFPYLSIIYRNTNGIESYWDYTQTSAGRAGTGYVNNYSGNLTWIHSDIGFGGNRMPVSISHIYNANDAQNNTYGLGYGWKTNFHQTLILINDKNNTASYLWEDGDGTKMGWS